MKALCKCLGALLLVLTLVMSFAVSAAAADGENLDDDSFVAADEGNWNEDSLTVVDEGDWDEDSLTVVDEGNLSEDSLTVVDEGNSDEDPFAAADEGDPYDGPLTAVEDTGAFDPDEVTITGVRTGDVATAYRLIRYAENYNNYVFDADFERFLQEKCGNANSLAAWMENLSATEITRVLEEYATVCNSGAEYQLPAAASETVTSAAEGETVGLLLHPGYYLILIKPTEDSSKIYQPISVFVKVEADKPIIYGGGRTEALPAENPTITVKSENGPTIEKRVNTQESGAIWAATADASVGETVHFYVRVDIPKYANITNLNMTLNDTLTHLKYVEGSARVYGHEPNEAGTFDEANLVAGALIGAEAGEYAQGQQALALTLDYHKIMDESESARSVWVVYDAVMTEDAVGNGVHSSDNSVYLLYANAATPDNLHRTEPSETTVYNYSIQLQKKGENVNVALAGAKFTFYSDEACQQPLSFVKRTQEEVEYYRLALPGEENEALTEVPADFLIRGLSSGTYYMKETTTPTGYFAPDGAFRIVLTSEMRSTTSHEHSGNLNGTTCTMTALEEADHELIATANVTRDIAYRFLIILKNTTTPNLPTTGGVGTAMFTVMGVALMALAALLVFFCRKKPAK